MLSSVNTVRAKQPGIKVLGFEPWDSKATDYITIVLTDDAEALRGNEQVRKTYLGES